MIKRLLPRLLCGALLLLFAASGAFAQTMVDSISATAVSSSEIDITWTEVYPDEDFSAVVDASNGSWIAMLSTWQGYMQPYTYAVTGLSPNTTYSYYIYVQNEDYGYDGSSSVVSATTLGPPNAPSGLSATAASGTQINLSWTNNGGGQTGFAVYRSTSSGGTYSQIGTTGSTTTTYSDTGLSNGTTYYYKVLATNSYGNSGYSNVANATTTGGVPNAPSGLSATSASSSEIDLSWTNNGGGQTGFAVFRSTSSGGTYSQIGTTGSTTTTYSDTGLAANTTYYYEVAATNSYGNSSYSSVANATTDAPSIYYVYTDQLNTPREITNAANTVIWSWDNTDPFGNNAANPDPEGSGPNFTFNPRFPGQYFDAETNLNYNWFRDYDPSIGRYDESDQLGLKGGLNTYLYALSPLSQVDPLGLMGHAPGRGPKPGNGNIWSGTGPQDYVCSFPAGALNGNICTKHCCVEHDKCYERNGCNWSSWLGNIFGAHLPCQQCNAQAEQCIIENIGKLNCNEGVCKPN